VSQRKQLDSYVETFCYDPVRSSTCTGELKFCHDCQHTLRYLIKLCMIVEATYLSVSPGSKRCTCIYNALIKYRKTFENYSVRLRFCSALVFFNLFYVLDNIFQVSELADGCLKDYCKVNNWVIESLFRFI